MSIPGTLLRREKHQRIGSPVAQCRHKPCDDQLEVIVAAICEAAQFIHGVPGLRFRKRTHRRRPQKVNGAFRHNAPAVRRNLDGAPIFVGEVEVDLTVMPADPNKGFMTRSFVDSARLKNAQRVVERGVADGVAGRVVILARDPHFKITAPDWPPLDVSVNLNARVSDPVGVAPKSACLGNLDQRLFLRRPSPAARLIGRRRLVIRLRRFVDGGRIENTIGDCLGAAPRRAIVFLYIIGHWLLCFDRFIDRPRPLAWSRRQSRLCRCRRHSSAHG